MNDDLTTDLNAVGFDWWSHGRADLGVFRDGATMSNGQVTLHHQNHWAREFVLHYDLGVYPQKALCGEEVSACTRIEAIVSCPRCLELLPDLEIRRLAGRK